MIYNLEAGFYKKTSPYKNPEGGEMIIAKNSKEFKKKNPGGVALSVKRQCHPFGVFIAPKFDMKGNIAITVSVSPCRRLHPEHQRRQSLAFYSCCASFCASARTA